MDFPVFYRVHQRFDQARLPDPAAAVRTAFAAFTPGREIKPGQSVAVGVGSRGLAGLVDLVRTTVACLKEMGLRPVIIPAMGSHGGASDEGQAKVLAKLGVTEASCGAPVVSHMATVSLGRLPSGAEISVAQDALAADHLVVINRVKPHTAFRNRVESGLCKMLTIGLGRRQGAEIVHGHGLAETLLPAAELILAKVPFLAGLATVETADHGLHALRLVTADEVVATDEALLKLAWQTLPRLPLETLDLLIVDRMGKDISGAGMDPNVVGFWRREGGERRPDYRTLLVLDLTPASEGNATGLGLADLTTRRLMDKVNFQATYTNALTSRVYRAVRVPLTLEHDRAALEAFLRTAPSAARLRLARIDSTLNLETFWVSAACLDELRAKPRLSVHPEPVTLGFEPDGRLRPFPA